MDKYVVKHATEDRYLQIEDPEVEQEPQFGPLETAQEFDTLQEAEAKATAINAGTVGTIKP